MIQCFHISKSFDPKRAVLHDVSLHIAPGDFACLIGASGSGKTAFLKILLGLEPLSEGHVLIGGRNLQQMSRRQAALARRRIGAVLQDCRMIPDRSLFENVALPLEISGADPAIIRGKVRRVLGRVGLEGRAYDLCRDLSEGEKQLAAVARACASEPPLVIADDPISRQDETGAAVVADLLSDLHDRGTTVLVASHEVPPCLEPLVGRVFNLRNGRIHEAVQLSAPFSGLCAAPGRPR